MGRLPGHGQDKAPYDERNSQPLVVPEPFMKENEPTYDSNDATALRQDPYQPSIGPLQALDEEYEGSSIKKPDKE